MKEKELLHEISRIVRDADGLRAALGRIRFVLESEWGGALLIIRPVSAAPFPAAVCEFLESREFPFRGLYTAPLETGASSSGTLVACVGTWGVPAQTIRTVTDFAGQQLTELVRRLSLPVLEYAEAA